MWSPQSLAIRTAEQKPDFSPFDQHRTKFEELWLQKGMTLDQVKKQMEDRHGFPETG
jgi:hypothetical protein